LKQLGDLVRSLGGPIVSLVEVSADVEIVSYDAATQTASVRPVVSVPVFGEDGAITGEVLSVVHGCPVRWPSGGGRSLCWGLSPGDRAKAIMRTRSHDEADSGAEAPVTPASTRTMSWSDAWIEPHDATPADPLGASARRSDGQPVFGLPVDEALFVGASTAALRLVIAEELRPFLAQFKTWGDTHTHPVAGGTATATTTPTPTVPPMADLASGRLKVDT
jgi:hypothetical protein